MEILQDLESVRNAQTSMILIDWESTWTTGLVYNSFDRMKALDSPTTLVEGVLLLLVSSIGVFIWWLIKRMLLVPEMYSTRVETTHLYLEAQTESKALRASFEAIKEQISTIEVNLAVLSRKIDWAESEIGTPNTGLRGSMHDVREEIGTALRTIHQRLGDR